MPSRLRGSLIITIVVLAIVAVVYLVYRFVPLSTLRDLAIILVALLDVVLLVLLVAIAFGIWKLISMIRTQLPPVIGSVTRTATTVEGTADFVSTTAAMPLIRTVSLLFAATRFVQVLFARGSGRGEQRP